MKMIVYLTSLNVPLVVMTGSLFYIQLISHLLHYSHVMTGSYNNTFHLYDREGKTDITLQADKSAFRSKRVGTTKKMSIARNSAANADSMDFSKKILHSSWHPRENTIAIAATNNLFIFT
jgi:serine/threonine-protein phosphatase 2A regulatory subunit B